MDKKGIPELYNEATQFLTRDKENFYDWIQTKNTTFVQGQICESIVWYEEKDRWILVEELYNPTDEGNTTWLAKPVRGNSLPPPRGSVIKYFNLEREEHLLAVNSKKRPVLLLKDYNNDWINIPGTSSTRKNWLCLPIFSYKDDRHTQEYVLDDQSLKSKSRFYMPISHNKNPGMTKESCVRIDALQMIQEESLSPIKQLCQTSEPKMQREFKVSNFGMTIIIKHMLQNLNLIVDKNYNDEYYELFQEYCCEAVQQVGTANNKEKM